MDHASSCRRLMAANWTLSPVIMCLICMVMSAVIYLPFLRAYERSLMKTEVEKAKIPYRLPKPLASNQGNTAGGLFSVKFK